MVTTARGTEFGHAAEDIIEVEEARIKELKSPMKPVLRLASAKDEEKAQKMEERSKEALPVFKQMAKEANEDMHPVSVEFLLEGDKAIFYFEAEERIDFRELVRNLASKFHARVDMRQIGVRDEARIIGGLGHCGQELCCKRMGGEFCPVSIRMAKEQDLSLNPQKISGVCGRLMCCLRYEFDAYKDFKKRAPKVNATIETPEGAAKVISLNVPREIVTLKLPDDKQVKIPLSEFEPPQHDERPTKIGKEALEAHLNQNAFGDIDDVQFSQFGDTSIFKEDSPGRKNTKARNSKEGSRSSRENGQGTSSRKPRRRTRTNKDGKPDSGQAAEAKRGASAGKQSQGAKKRQSSKGQRNQGANAQGQSRSRNGGQGSGQKNKQGVRPGQRSSALRGSQGGAQSGQSNAGSTSDGQRRSRRRSHKAGGNAAGGSDER